MLPESPEPHGRLLQALTLGGGGSRNRPSTPPRHSTSAFQEAPTSLSCLGASRGCSGEGTRQLRWSAVRFPPLLPRVHHASPHDLRTFVLCNLRGLVMNEEQQASQLHTPSQVRPQEKDFLCTAPLPTPKCSVTRKALPTHEGVLCLVPIAPDFLLPCFDNILSWGVCSLQR